MQRLEFAFYFGEFSVGSSLSPENNEGCGLS